MEALSGELAGVRASLAEAQAARDAAQSQLAEAQRALGTNASAAAELQAQLASREAQLATLQEAQRASLAVLSVRGRPTAGDEGDASLAELRGQLEAQRAQHAAELERLSAQVRGAGWTGGGGAGGACWWGDSPMHGMLLRVTPARPLPLPLPHQLAEAQALAGYSAGEMAEVVQALAEAQGERGEAAAKLAEAREEVGRLRSGALLGGRWGALVCRGSKGQGCHVGGACWLWRKCVRPAHPRALHHCTPPSATTTATTPPSRPAGPEGDLRARIERLEKDVTIQRNRADVNALFKEEHDRWGGLGRLGWG